MPNGQMPPHRRLGKLLAGLVISLLVGKLNIGLSWIERIAGYWQGTTARDELNTLQKIAAITRGVPVLGNDLFQSCLTIASLLGILIVAVIWLSDRRRARSAALLDGPSESLADALRMPNSRDVIHGLMGTVVTDAPQPPPTQKKGKRKKPKAPARFVGQWQTVAVPKSPSFTMTLNKSFGAQRSDGQTGRWRSRGNQAWIVWADGWRDHLRIQSTGNAMKTAWERGKTWKGEPHNMQPAIKLPTVQSMSA